MSRANGHAYVFGYLIWALLLCVVFAGLTWLITVNPVLGVDIRIEQAVQTYRTPALDTLAQAVSWIGFPPEVIAIDAVFVIALFLMGHRWEAVCGAIAAAGGAALWFVLIGLVHRPRPSSDLVRVFADIPLSGFPSGHVLNLTVFFGFLGWLSLHRMRPGPLRTLCVGGCASLLVAIGLARIYSGEHWPTDVLAGYVLGTAWLLLSISLYLWRAEASAVAQPA